MSKPITYAIIPAMGYRRREQRVWRGKSWGKWFAPLDHWRGLDAGLLDIQKQIEAMQPRGWKNNILRRALEFR